MPPTPIRVAVCATHPIQYQAPLWRRLAARPELDLRAYFGTDMSVRGYKDREFGVSLSWDTPLLEGYAHTFLSTDPSIQRITLRSPGAKGLHSALRNFRPQVGVMTAYMNRFHLGAWSAFRKLRVPIVMRHEASDVAHARSGWKAKLRDSALRLFYARIDRFAVIGTESRRHLLRLGVSESKLGNAPYCVDSDFVATQAATWLPRRAKLRAELGIADTDRVLVFSGKLIPKKDPFLICEAIAALASGPHGSMVERLHVVFAGDGELRAALEERMKLLLGSRAHFLGFLNQGLMGKAYAVGDALVLPSRRGSGETWGLVVNEAMQYGLPAIVSDGVGCHVDLVSPGQTGWVFLSGDVAGLVGALTAFIRLDAAKAETMKSAIAAAAQAYSLDSAAIGLAEAIKFVALRQK